MVYVQGAGNIRAEIDDDGGERSDMNRNIQRKPLVAPARQQRIQRQMPGRRDRKELGYSLDQGEQDQVEKRHRKGL